MTRKTGLPDSFLQLGGTIEMKNGGSPLNLPYHEILELKWKSIQIEKKQKQRNKILTFDKVDFLKMNQA
jgi:hypothetical protein